MVMAKNRKKGSRKRRFWGFLLLGLLVILIVGYRFIEDIGPEKEPSDRFGIKRVIDGDTAELTGGDRLRLLSLDTPEKGEKFSEQATALFNRLVSGKPVRIEYAGNRRDRYGRILGYLFVDDTLLVNRTIIDSGLAYLYLFDNAELQRNEVKQMLDAQRSAIARRVGLWSVKRTPEDHYVATEHSFRLHRPWCESVKNLKPGHYRSFQSREEGLALGLSPCRNCKP
jgi:micrococcal nuclease